MTNYALPVNDKDISKAKTFYDLICWGGLLIVLLPVGIANVILGYFMGDSPCTLCWGQRQEMAYIGVVALFMVRYGFKPKYLATMLVMAAVGLYMSFRHYGNHAMRDVGQGFGLDVFGIHTQFWAEIVFWCVVFLFGLAVYLAPRFDALVAEFKGKAFRPMTKFNRVAFGIVTAIIASNCFQALWSTGVPPFWGQGDPVRFSFNPKYVIWSSDSWEGMWSGIDFLGKRNVKDPDFAYKPNAAKLGIEFKHDAADAPVKLTGRPPRSRTSVRSKAWTPRSTRSRRSTASTSSAPSTASGLLTSPSSRSSPPLMTRGTPPTSSTSWPSRRTRTTPSSSWAPTSRSCALV